MGGGMGSNKFVIDCEKGSRVRCLGTSSREVHWGRERCVLVLSSLTDKRSRCPVQLAFRWIWLIIAPA